MPDNLLEKELDSLDDVYEEEDDQSAEDSENNENETDAEENSKSEEDSDDKETEDKEKTDEETESEEADDSDKEDKKQKDTGKEGDETAKDLDEPSRIAKLVAEVERLSGLVSAPVLQTDEKEKEKKTVVDVDVVASDLIDFVGDLDMDDVASDSKVFNTLLNKVLQQGIVVGKKLNQDSFATDVPQVVADQVSRFSQNQIMIDQFYKDNEDLINVKQVVKACATQVASENPDKGLEFVLKKAAENARKTLGFKRPVKQKSSDPNSAAFAKQKGGQRKKAKKISKLQQELDEL